MCSNAQGSMEIIAAETIYNVDLPTQGESAVKGVEPLEGAGVQTQEKEKKKPPSDEFLKVCGFLNDRR